MTLAFYTLAIASGVISGFGATAVVIKAHALSITVKPYEG